MSAELVHRGPFVSFKKGEGVLSTHVSRRMRSIGNAWQNGHVCTTCGGLAYRIGDGAGYTENTGCRATCKNCYELEDEHAAGWCLFRPTKFTHLSFRVKLNGEFVDGD